MRAAVADRWWLRGVAACGMLLFTCILPTVAVAAPDWVNTSGSHVGRYPVERYVTGYGQARGREAEARARQAAMASLAQAVHVRIEFELEDDRREDDGRYDASVAALTRTSSVIELQDVRFEIHRTSRRVHALAIVERADAGARRRGLRDRALVRAEACVADAELARETGDVELAERRLARCRSIHDDVLRHEAVSTAMTGEAAGEEVATRLEHVEGQLERVERETRVTAVRSPAEAADRLASLLAARGLVRPRRVDLAAWVDGGTELPSPFGQVMAFELERALAEVWSDAEEARRDPRRIEIEGTHVESGDEIRLAVIAREFGTGTLLASAATTLPRDGVPDGLALRPENWQPALEKRDRLADVPTSEFRDTPDASPLRVEVWTDRGRERLHYTEGDAIRVFFRVNAPAWVRVVYVLSNGLTVPIEESFHVDADRAQSAIALPGRLEVVAPFGVEMLHVAAFEAPPTPLVTRRVMVAGEPYDVIDEGVDALVRARGVRLSRGEAVAEDVLTITTLASAGANRLRPRDRR